MTSMPNNLELADIVDAMDRQVRLCGKLYMHLAKPVLGQFAQKGERTVRLALRRLGALRAGEMRAAHHALGKPINMQSLTQCWDNAGNFLVKDEMETDGNFRPQDSRYNVSYCPVAEVWKEADFHQWGHVYCDEFHQACASSYHPDGNVVVPINMMKGDEQCEFQWIMPPDATELNLGEPTELGKRLARDYRPSSDLEDAWMTLRRSNRLFAIWFIALAGKIMEAHGEAPVIEALRNWGEERGKSLRAWHQSKGIAISISNFMRHHDLPAAQVWSVKSGETPGGDLDLTIEGAPQDDAFADHDIGRLGALLYRESYPAMLAAYLPGATFRWQELCCEGGSVNRFTLCEPEVAGQ